MEHLPPQALAHVANYFQALSEPTRLTILNLLRDGERNVGELAQLTGYTSANISRHVALLVQQGLVGHGSRGNAVYCHIADESVFALCEVVCGNIARLLERAAAGREPFRRAARAKRARG